MIWVAVMGGALGCYAVKVAGLSVPSRVLEMAPVRRIAALLPVALLATLVVSQTFSTGHSLTLDARAAGLTVAVVAQWRKAPFIVVVSAATLVTALVRVAS